MVFKELMICLFLLNAIILTNLQIIHDQQDRCCTNVDKDLLLKVRELQLELSMYREQSVAIERLLRDKLSKVEHDYLAYRNESMDRYREQKESERLLLDRLNNVEHEFSAF